MRKSGVRATTTLLIVAITGVAVWTVVSGQSAGHPGEAGAPQVGSQPGVVSSITMPESASPMTVAHVHDGDTLFLANAEGTELKVRLIGVDTPELRPSEECYAVEARDHLRSLTPDGSTVRVAADVEALDQYGRSLFYLWTESGEFVNLRLVAEGYGTALKVEPNSAHWGDLLDAERTAQTAGAGMWSECSSA